MTHFFATLLRQRRLAIGACPIILAGCAAATVGHDAIAPIELFDAAGSARFRLEYSCAGQVAAETDLCWVPSKYFSLWARDRGVPVREVAALAESPVATAAAADNASDVAYRVYVRFAPVSLASYSSETDGMGGYRPPRAGYDVDIYIYTNAGMLVDHANHHRKTDAAYMGDAVPYVKAGVKTVLSALDPGHLPEGLDGPPTRCQDRAGRTSQGCGAPGG